MRIEKSVVISSKYFKDQYKDAKYQFVVACGRFDCDLRSASHAVFVQKCTQNNTEYYRIERWQIIRIVNDKLITEWKKGYGEFDQKALERIEKYSGRNDNGKNK